MTMLLKLKVGTMTKRKQTADPLWESLGRTLRDQSLNSLQIINNDITQELAHRLYESILGNVYFIVISDIRQSDWDYNDPT